MPQNDHVKGSQFLSFSKGIFFLVATLLLIPLLIGSVFALGGSPWYKSIKAEVTEQPYARTVTVNGEGKISAKPDIALISLSVESAGKTVKEVTLDNNNKMNKVIAEVKALGVKAEDITTTGYNLYPRYSDSYVISPITSVKEAKTPEIIGYTLSQSVQVKVRDLSKVDDVLDKGILAGANQVGGLSFDIDDTGKIKAAAREQAFQKAREKAEAMAQAAGVKLGRVVTFSESYNNYPLYSNYAMNLRTADMAAEAVAPSIEAGSKDLNVNVSVTYEIE